MFEIILRNVFWSTYDMVNVDGKKRYDQKKDIEEIFFGDIVQCMFRELGGDPEAAKHYIYQSSHSLVELSVSWRLK